MSTSLNHFATQTLTCTAFLDGLCDPADHKSWGSLVQRYRPMLIGFAARLGLRPPDAEDAAQIILMEFAKAYSEGGYDRSKGRLRQWLFGIARKQISNCKRRRPREQSPLKDSRTTGFFDRLPDNTGGEQQMEAATLARCLDLVRAEVSPQTMDAFHLFAILDQPAAEVARSLGMTENAVFGAKRRVLARIRELAAGMSR